MSIFIQSLYFFVSCFFYISITILLNLTFKSFKIYSKLFLCEFTYLVGFFLQIFQSVIEYFQHKSEVKYLVSSPVHNFIV